MDSISTSRMLLGRSRRRRARQVDQPHAIHGFEMPSALTFAVPTMEWTRHVRSRLRMFLGWAAASHTGICMCTCERVDMRDRVARRTRITPAFRSHNATAHFAADRIMHLLERTHRLRGQPIHFLRLYFTTQRYWFRRHRGRAFVARHKLQHIVQTIQGHSSLQRARWEWGRLARSCRRSFAKDLIGSIFSVEMLANRVTFTSTRVARRLSSG